MNKRLYARQQMSECSREMRKGNNLDPVAEMLKPFECNVCAKS